MPPLTGLLDDNVIRSPRADALGYGNAALAGWR
jgi:hypothetical protein